MEGGAAARWAEQHPSAEDRCWNRAEGQARKRPLLGRALGLHRAKAGSAAGSTGSREGVGAVSPVMVITYMLLGSRTEDFVSELNCVEEHWPFHQWGFFYQILFSTPNFLSVDNSADSHLCRWGPCAEPGLLLIPRFKSHTNTSKVSLDLQGTVGSRSHGCTFLMAYPRERAPVGTSRAAESRGVPTAARTP